MEKIVTFIINIIWPMAFAYLFTTAVLFFIKIKTKKSWKEFLISTLVLTGMAVFLVGIYVFKEKSFKADMHLIFEAVSWLVIIYNIVINWKMLFKRKKISKNSLIIFCVAICVGVGSIVILGTGNSTYVAPSNEYGYIGNFYFNADVTRGILTALSPAEPHLIHPGYRFILMPFTFIPLIYNFITKNPIGKYSTMITNGYLICAIQVILNSISAVLFYKILKQEKINEKISILGAILFIVSIANIWLSILPETYGITLLTLLLFIYLYNKSSKLCIAFAIAAVATNLMAAIPIIFVIIKNIKQMPGKKGLVIKMLIGFIAFISASVMFNTIKTYIFAWSSSSLNSLEGISSSINYFVVSLLIGPNYLNIYPYFVQIADSTIASMIFILTLVILMIFGYITKWKKTVPILCMRVFNNSIFIACSLWIWKTKWHNIFTIIFMGIYISTNMCYSIYL